ncbi:hypothetical protein CL620_03760 [archaeon]|nr:hypothetical protein [archaeon]|tara:strand:- start:675 stop:917 length:243 start_codon:yes stop_codon:yes gene_type:complete
MAALELAEVILAVIIGTLAAIVYSLRVLILLERRVAGMEMNIQRMTSKVLREEQVIERMVSRRSPKRASSTRKTTRKRRR